MIPLVCNHLVDKLYKDSELQTCKQSLYVVQDLVRTIARAKTLDDKLPVFVVELLKFELMDLKVVCIGHTDEHHRVIVGVMGHLNKHIFVTDHLLR